MESVNREQQALPNSARENNAKSRRGFASMDKQRHKMVSSKGGKSPRNNETAVRVTSTPPGYSGL